MGGNSRFEMAYFRRPWHEFADEETLEAKIESTETCIQKLPIWEINSLA